MSKVETPEAVTGLRDIIADKLEESGASPTEMAIALVQVLGAVVFNLPGYAPKNFEWVAKNLSLTLRQLAVEAGWAGGLNVFDIKLRK